MTNIAAGKKVSLLKIILWALFVLLFLFAVWFNVWQCHILSQLSSGCENFHKALEESRKSETIKGSPDAKLKVPTSAAETKSSDMPKL